MPLAQLSAEVYSGHFDDADGPFDFVGKLRLKATSSKSGKTQAFCHVLARRDDGYAVVVFRGTRTSATGAPTCACLWSA